MVVVTLFTMMGCNLDYFNPDKFAIESYPATYAVPVMQGSLTLEDVLTADTTDKSQFQENGGLLMMRAADTATIVPHDVYWIAHNIGIKPILFNESMISNFEASGEYNYSDTCFMGHYGPYKPNIIEGNISSGYLEVNITTNLNHNGTVTIYTPHFTQNGEMKNTIFEISAVDNQRTLTQTISLANTTWTYPEVWDKIITTFDISFSNSGNVTSDEDFIRIECQLKDVRYFNLTGTLHDHWAARTAKVPLGFLKKLSGEIEFADPRVNVYYSSSFGTYTGIEIEDIYTFKKGGKTYKRQFGGPPKNGMKMIDPSTGPTDYNTYNVAFTNETSEFIGGAGSAPPGVDPTKVMSYAFENSPDSLYADYFLRTNPNDEFLIGEFYDGSQYNIITEVLLPFEGAAELYMLDTFDYNFITEEAAESIDYVILKLIIGNGLPVDANIRIDVYNQHPWNGSLNKLFALKSTKGDINIKAAEVDSDGRAIGVKSQTIDIRLERAQVKMLAEGEKMIVTSDITTPRNEAVILSADNELQLQIGVKVKAGIPLDELN